MTRFRKFWWTGALASLVLVPAAFAEISPTTALEAYRRGNYRGSQAQYAELAKEDPQDARLRFNAGAAAYRQNDLTNATAWFESVLGAPDLRLQQQAYYNLGNTQFRLGEALPEPQVRRQLWGQALTNFGSALKLDGADTNAAANYALVRQKLQELEEQTPPPQQQQQQQDQPDNSPDQDPQSDSSQQQQQQQQSDNSDSSQQDSQDPSGRPPSEPKDSSGDQPEPPSDKQEQQGDSSDSAGQNPQDGEKPGAAAEGRQGEGQEAAGAGEQRDGEMSAAQAVQMLESQKGEEKALLLRAYGSGKEAAERAARIRKPW